MAQVKVTEDVLVPHPSGREGTYHLVARKGQMVDERVLKAAKAGDLPASNLITSTDRSDAAVTEPVSGGVYDEMGKSELRELVETRGLEPAGSKKSDYIDALEAHDAGA